jgi:hypothetical protein
MRFNFSEVSSNINEVEESFRLHCCGKLRHFLQKYEHILGKEIWNVLNEETLEEPGALLSAINSYATLKGDIKIYLLIDEYDNFTNTILSTYGTDLYRKATHGEGYIRRFFNVIKAATTGMGSAVNRLFITGVSPVTMDDVTSGFNIGTNITTDQFIWESPKTGLPCNPTHFRDVFRKSLEEAGDVRLLTPHSCRHTTNWLQTSSRSYTKKESLSKKLRNNIMMKKHTSFWPTATSQAPVPIAVSMPLGTRGM